MRKLKEFIKTKKSEIESKLQGLTMSEELEITDTLNGRIDAYDEVLEYISKLESANKNEIEIKGAIARDRNIHKYFKTNLFMYADDVNIVYDEDEEDWQGDGTEWALPMEAFPEVKASDKGCRDITITITLD